MTTATMFKDAVRRSKKSGPLWQGPEATGPLGGVTQSMLANWLVCRERFRVKYVEGLQPHDRFNHRTGYGDMWHVCEESHARDDGRWAIELTQFCEQLCRRYPLQQEEIDKWYQVCKVQFPLYVKHWDDHEDVKDRTPLLQEQVFDVPYRLPSGRTVRLRGKWDSVDLIGRGQSAGVWLQENKTKGDVDEQRITTQLSFDLQTMLYLVALAKWFPGYCSTHHGLAGSKPPPIFGVRYNVVRRPLSGGKGTIVRHKATKNKRAETDAEYWQRLHGIIDGSPQEFFLRLKVEISQADIALFRRTCLDPILEQLCDWYDYVCNDDPKSPTRFATAAGLNYRMPYGVYSPLLDGGGTDYDNYLATGSTVGLERVDTLFKECA